MKLFLIVLLVIASLCILTSIVSMLLFKYRLTKSKSESSIFEDDYFLTPLYTAVKSATVLSVCLLALIICSFFCIILDYLRVM